MKCKLSDICSFRKGKISVDGLNRSTYISTENMLPNKCGITEASSLPTVQLTQEYKKGDVLVSNIRPYFKKIWKATYDGGCSNDVLVFAANSNTDKDFLYYILANDDFFAYSMATSKGTKMPRGDKTSIMQYEVPVMDIELISNTSGAEIIRDDFYEYLNDQQTQSEKQCDVFANAFLVPIDDFKVELEKSPIDEDRITDLAILYSVSKEAIMYKLLTMKKITHKDYDRLKETFYGDALRNIPKKGKDGSGGNYYLTKLSYLGQRYAGDVFREYFSGRIDNVRASEMLNSKIDHLPKLESAYFRGLK